MHAARSPDNREVGSLARDVDAPQRPKQSRRDGQDPCRENDSLLNWWLSRSAFVECARAPYALRGDRAIALGHCEVGERNGIALRSHDGPTDWAGLDERPRSQLARRNGFPYALTIDRATVRGQDTRGMRMIELNSPTARANDTVRQLDPQVPLRALLSALPAGTMLPASWVLERISVHGVTSAGSHAETLSVQEFAEQRVPRRTPDWVREKCADGIIDGAFKDGGEWRIPVAALTQQIPRARADATGGVSQDAMPATRASGAPTYPRW